jgi:hypothetical protein
MKLSTSIERQFRLLPSGRYQEFFVYFIHVLDENSGNILRSKIDKIVVGKLYRKGNLDERALFGDDVTYTLQNEGKCKLIPVVNINELSCKRLSYVNF